MKILNQRVNRRRTLTFISNFLQEFDARIAKRAKHFLRERRRKTYEFTYKGILTLEGDNRQSAGFDYNFSSHGLFSGLW